MTAVLSMMLTNVATIPVAIALFFAAIIEFAQSSSPSTSNAPGRGIAALWTSVTFILVALVVCMPIARPDTMVAGLKLFLGGTFMLLVGMRWLRRAIFNAASVTVERSAAISDPPAGTVAASDDSRLSRRDDIDRLLASLTVPGLVWAAGAIGEPMEFMGVSAMLSLAITLGIGVIAGAWLPARLETLLRFFASTIFAAVGMFWAAESFGFHWGGQHVALMWLIPLLLLSASGLTALLHSLDNRASRFLRDDDQRKAEP